MFCTDINITTSFEVHQVLYNYSIDNIHTLQMVYQEIQFK